ncbi:MAG: DUF3048 domain-containing protein [Candidatus Geothermincolales bacterium]
MRGMNRKGRKALTAAVAALFLISLLSPSLSGCGKTEAVTPQEEDEPQGQEAPVNPLTGEKVASWDLVSRRPLAIKVENEPPARPQSGLLEAELVFEELVEGGATRFICVYLANECPVVGPVRSARPSDIDIIYFLKPLLTCSGGSSQVMRMVESSGIMFVTEDSSFFWRDRNRRMPHNLYTSTELLRRHLEEEKDGFRGPVYSGLSFMPEGGEDEAGEKGAQPSADATSLAIHYPDKTCKASYSYDAASRRYLRSTGGKAHTDLKTGKQLAPANVIVQFVKVQNSSLRDAAGSPVPVSQVVGSGRCLVFSGGKVFVGRWKKGNRNSPTSFTDEEGRPILLRPGQTWIHLVGEDFRVDYR